MWVKLFMLLPNGKNTIPYFTVERILFTDACPCERDLVKIGIGVYSTVVLMIRLASCTASQSHTVQRPMDSAPCV